jgi:predicted AlkP superfamily phosphohydrolase/phosphomutase
MLGLLAAALASPNLVIVSWDGAADWVVDRLLAEGKLPNLAKMAQTGVRAESSIPTFPSKTAVSHFAIFSGTHPSRSQVTGNAVPLLPRDQHTVLESTTGFGAGVHQTEPLWVTTARAGLKTVALSAAGSFPPAPDQARLAAVKVPLDRYVEFSGFEASLEPGRVIDVSQPSGQAFRLGETEFTAAALDDPADPVVGFDTVEIRSQGETRRLKPAPVGKLSAWTGGLIAKKGALTGIANFRLFALDPKTGVSDLWSRQISGMQGTQSAAENLTYLRAYGGFHDDPWDPYFGGKFGKTVYQGGNGEAEARVVELVQFDCELLKRSFRYGWNKYRPRVAFHYSPMTDSAGHAWMGAMDPTSPSYRPEIAERLWPYYTAVFQAQDDWLGDMMKVAGRNTAFALVADHGMAGISQYVNVNFALESAGLLKYGPDNQIDLTQTRALCPAWSDFAVVINGTDWKGGIVSAVDRPRVLRQVEATLRGIVDPVSGQAVIERMWRPDEFVHMGIGGPAGGDLYFDLVPGYYPSPRKGDLYSPARAIIGNGVHGFDPTRRTMQAIFYASGPGITPGKQIPPVRVIDIVPSLCTALGLPVPPQPDGQAIRL